MMHAAGLWQFLGRSGRTLLQGCGNLLFPPICSLCDVDLGDERADLRLCEACLARLAAEPTHRCPKCAARIARTFQEADCPWCRTHDLRFDRAVTLGTYDGMLREAVLRTKRFGAEPLTAALIGRLWDRVGDVLLAEQIDVVLPIPMHWRRRLRRGHNEPELMSAVLAKHLKVCDRPRGLVRRRSTSPQVGLSVPQRRENVRNAFVVSRFCRVTGKRVLLVDDILTSGATCSEAARVLKRAGAASVVVAVLARAQGET